MHGSTRFEGWQLGCRGWVAALVILPALLAAQPALADAARARAHYEKGRSYFQLGEYRKALEEFKNAHVEKNDVANLYNIAECHRQLGEPKEAVAFYQRFVRLVPPDHPLRSDAERRIAELQASVGVSASR
jgi:tetratricopeptide (TPR) repeat protein